ncbi:MAG: ABC transporter permease subunit, partial [Anaerolineaceae bacterium]
MSAVAARALYPWPASRAAAILTTIGGTLLAGFVLSAIFAPLLAPFDPARQVGAPFESPSTAHLLGTDDIGQDLLSQLIYGTRVSLAVGIGAAAIATVVATAAGLVAGFLRGWVDVLFIRVADVMLALPVLPLLLVLSAFLQPGRAVQAVTIGLILAPRAAREIRARVLTVSRLGPVDAARSMGAPASHLLFRHVFPATVAIVVAQFVRAVAGAIAFESSLSFLGLGNPTSRSWGTILFFANARGAFFSSAWLWWVIPPGACIGLTVVAFAFLGFGVEERSDPRLRASSWRLTSVRRLRHGGPAPEASRPPLLVVDNLSIAYGRRDAVRALAGVSFSVESGNLVVVTGASGSGKSTLAGAIMGMVRSPGRVVSGRVLFEGRDLAQLSAAERRSLRGLGIALVPQAAMNALHPALTVTEQLSEAIQAHRRVGRTAARDRAGELLFSVGVPPERLNAFPHQL